MEYTIQQVAKMANVSSRTLRYYDEIGLLKPKAIRSSGHRIYGQTELTILQNILFYRSLHLPLKEIKAIVTNPNFDFEEALVSHHQQLVAQRQQIETLITTVEKTLLSMKGELVMTDQEKFEGFKKELLEKNETLYGEELRTKYSEEEIDASYQKWRHLTAEEIDNITKIEQELFSLLEILSQSHDYSSKEAQDVFEKHKQWLKLVAPFYNKEYHLSLAECYLSDERFSDYYNNRAGKDAARTLTAIIQHYA